MMTLIKNTKKNLAIFSLAILFAAPSAQAVSYVPSSTSIKNTAEAAFFCAIFYSAYEFYTRKPTNDPAAYNIDELMALTNVSENLKGLWFDGVWGHPGKSTSIKVDENGNVVAETTRVNSKGLMGYLVHNGKSLFAAFATSYLIKVTIESLAEKSDRSFLEVFADKINKQCKLLGFKILPDTLGTITGITPSPSK